MKYIKCIPHNYMRDANQSFNEVSSHKGNNGFCGTKFGKQDKFVGKRESGCDMHWCILCGK